MPIYEYKCWNCNHKFEKIKDIKWKDSEEICSNCGVIVSRVISKPSFKVNGYNEKNGYSDAGGEE